MRFVKPRQKKANAMSFKDFCASTRNLGSGQSSSSKPAAVSAAKSAAPKQADPKAKVQAAPKK